MWRYQKLCWFFLNLAGSPRSSLLLKFSSKHPIRLQWALLPSGQWQRPVSLPPGDARPSRGRREPQGGTPGGNPRRTPREGTTAGQPPHSHQSLGVTGRAPLSLGHGWRCNRYLYDGLGERTAGGFGGSPAWPLWRSGDRGSSSPVAMPPGLPAFWQGALTLCLA